MPTLRRALPLVLVALATVEVVTAAAAVPHVKTAHREAVAAAARHRAEVAHTRAVALEKKKEDAYRGTLVPVVDAVFDAAQPLQDVSDAFAADTSRDKSPERDLLLSTRDDVLSRSGAVTSLAGAQRRLAATTPPAALAEPARRLRQALTTMVAAAELLDHATHEKGDSHGIVSTYGDGFDALENAESSWQYAVTEVFTQGTQPTPSDRRVNAVGRKTATHGTYLRAADRACGVGGEALGKIEDKVHDQPSLLIALAEEPPVFLTMLHQLETVPVPAGGAGVADLPALLEAHEDYARLLVTLRGELAHGTPATAQDRARLHGTETQERQLHEAFQAYGATVCSDVFDPGNELDTGTLDA